MFGHFRRGCPHVNCVERRMFREAEAAVPLQEGDAALAQHLPALRALLHVGAPEGHQLRHVLHAPRLPLRAHHGAHAGRQVSGAAADVQHVRTLVQVRFKHLQAVRVHVRGAHGHAVPDSVRVVHVGVSLAGGEVTPVYEQHSVLHARMGDEAVRCQGLHKPCIVARVTSPRHEYDGRDKTQGCPLARHQKGILMYASNNTSPACK
mmetsp:Transcript_19737/g.43145  ORF Transcript_19737/g.43145 Transcript_19737/m.43145 type:complete len:206 (-) Transcript_19737:4-621(-)